MRKTGATAVLHTEMQKGANARTITSTKEWNALKDHVKDIEKTHLRDLLKNYDRCENLTLEHDGVYVDYARQRVTEETMEKLYAHFGWDNFDADVKPVLKEYAESLTNFKKNSFSKLSDDAKKLVQTRWKRWFTDLNYDM